MPSRTCARPKVPASTEWGKQYAGAGGPTGEDSASGGGETRNAGVCRREQRAVRPSAQDVIHPQTKKYKPAIRIEDTHKAKFYIPFTSLRTLCSILRAARLFRLGHTVGRSRKPLRGEGRRLYKAKPILNDTCRRRMVVFNIRIFSDSILQLAGWFIDQPRFNEVEMCVL